MVIQSLFVRENKEYTIEQLRYRLKFPNNTTEEKRELSGFVKELLAHRVICKPNKEDNDKNTDEEMIDNDFEGEHLVKDSERYKFCFVGIVIVKNRVIYSYPKYLNEYDKFAVLEEHPDQLAECKRKMQQVMQILDKYFRDNNKKKVISDVSFFADDTGDKTDNVLPVMLYLLDDFERNGGFEKTDKELEINGGGDINWPRTIDYMNPIVVDNQPYYVELYTKVNITDESDYVYRLHKCVVAKCSEELQNASLTDFYGLPIEESSNDDLDSFGDEDYIISRLETELGETYEDRKILVLKALIAYFRSDKVLLGDQVLQLIGTRAFHAVWEWACREVFKSDHKKTLEELLEKKIVEYKNLGGEESGIVFTDEPPTLIELIEKPVWVRGDTKDKTLASKTFVPDYLGFDKVVGLDAKKSYTLYIIDAKYYCPEWKNKSIQDCPGVEDIGKQYMYLWAYRNVKEKLKINYDIKNYFIMPKTKSLSVGYGAAFIAFLNAMGGKTIEVRMYDPEFLFDICLNDDDLPLSDLDSRFLKTPSLKKEKIFEFDEYRDMDKRAAEPPQTE